MYFWEKKPCRVTIWICVFGDKLLCHETFNFYSFCLSFYLEVTRFIFVLHLWHRWKQLKPRKPLLYYLLFNDKQLRCENYFYHVFITVRQNEHVMKPLNNYFYSPFLQKFIYLKIFQSVSILNMFILSVRIYAIICVCWPIHVINFN